MSVALVSASTQYVVLADEACYIYQNVTGATLMAWLSVASTPSSELMAVHFSTGSSTSNARLSLSYRGVETRWRVSARRLDANSVSSVNGTSAPSIGQVCHVCGVAEYSNQILRLYVNGVQENTLTITGWTGASSDTASQSARIGSTGTGASYYNGAVTDVRTYNRVLSADEIASIYRARGRDSGVSGLGDRWKLLRGGPGTAFSSDKSVGPNQADATSGYGPPTYAENMGVAIRSRSQQWQM